MILRGPQIFPTSGATIRICPYTDVGAVNVRVRPIRCNQVGRAETIRDLPLMFF
jgi:hypothetical protein